MKRLLADAELDYGVSGGRIGKLLSLFIAAANGPARQVVLLRMRGSLNKALMAMKRKSGTFFSVAGVMIRTTV